MKETTPGPAMPTKKYLRRVTERIPKPFYETDKFLGTRMVGVHIIEKLECGHVKDAFPQCDPLTARHRACHACERDEVPASLPLKKPAQPERAIPRWRMNGAA